MTALDHLAALLDPATREGAKPMMSHAGIDQVILDMKARFGDLGGSDPTEDHQLDAVRRFWDSQEVKSFRDAYLLSWSLTLPHRSSGLCILEDGTRLARVLDGVDTWQKRPAAFRRCYQGLARSYFTYDPVSKDAPASAKTNWRTLRAYLGDRQKFIEDSRLNPAWVDTALKNRQLFSDRPCDGYVDALLRGDSTVVDQLCEHMGINKASWFLRELVLAQVRRATKLEDTSFQELLPRLLSVLAANEVLRDRGMILLLDRYAEIAGTPLNQLLREQAVNWWGNPWLPSNETRWGGVTDAARSMVADWLKLEFIETFFTKLAEDGLGDPRRMNFWKQYVKAIDHIEFALGTAARSATSPDLALLRKKMAGLICTLDAPGTNNAFIMRMGSLVAVEFSGLGNAFYGYDAHKSVPFDTKAPLRLAVGTPNSLKHKGASILRLSHQDGIHNWDKWEDMFAATLRQEFGIEPSAKAPVPRRSAQAVSPGMTSLSSASVQYSRAALSRFAREHRLTIDDKSAVGGNLWVLAEHHAQVNSASLVTETLLAWGFKRRAGKGWWK